MSGAVSGRRISKADRKAVEVYCTHGDYCRKDPTFECALIVPTNDEIFDVPQSKLKIQFYTDDTCF
jgi:hypothetical protein